MILWHSAGVNLNRPIMTWMIFGYMPWLHSKGPNLVVHVSIGSVEPFTLSCTRRQSESRCQAMVTFGSTKRKLLKWLNGRLLDCLMHRINEKISTQLGSNKSEQGERNGLDLGFRALFIIWNLCMWDVVSVYGKCGFLCNNLKIITLKQEVLTTLIPSIQGIRHFGKFKSPGEKYQCALHVEDNWTLCKFDSWSRNNLESENAIAPDYENIKRHHNMIKLYINKGLPLYLL